MAYQSSKKRKVKRRRKGRPSGRIRRKLPHSYKRLTIFIFVALTVYLLGYIIAFVNKPSIAVETVAYGTIDAPATLKGIIVRNEYVEKSKKEGKPYYNYAENERVKKGSMICSIRDEEKSGLIENKIEKIDKDILKKQKNRSDLSAFQDDITRIEGNISQTVDSYAGKFMLNDFSSLYSMKNQVEVDISQRNEIWMAESVESLAQLSETKNQYEAQLATSMHSIAAKGSGILSFKYDKLEESLNFKSIDKVTKEQTTMKLTPEYLSKTKVVSKGEPLFKLVTSNQWYVVTYVPLEVVTGWEKGDIKTLSASIEEEEKLVSVKIYSLDLQEKEARVVFVSDQNIIDFIGERTMEFKIKSELLEGIKVPNTAMIEKTLLKLPKECITESMGEKGVMKVSGHKESFVPLDIAKYDDGQGFSYVMQDYNHLQVGDVVLQGTGKEPKHYTISDVHTYKGVFGANSSVAKFIIVEVLGQNKDCSIVRPGTSSYELQAYDTIVSDAQNIEEGQILY